MATLAERITAEPEQCGGRPCVRSMRIRVTDVLDLLASGLRQTRSWRNYLTLSPKTSQLACGLRVNGLTIQCRNQ